MERRAMLCYDMGVIQEGGDISMSLLEVSNLKKIYTTRFGGAQVQALSNVSFSVVEGEYVAIMGESGSGKTTLLNILAALDRPTSGQVLLDGRDITGIPERELAAFRRDKLGFVFQDFNLLDTFTLRDNIFLPLVLAGKSFVISGRFLNHSRDELPIEVKARYDGEYAADVTFRRDVSIFFHSITYVFARRGVVEGGTGALDAEKRDGQRR